MQNYDELTIDPSVIARNVCLTQYTGREISNQGQDKIIRIEEKRKQLTEEEINSFVRFIDEQCKSAYHNQTKWFMNVINSKTNAGRDYLWNVISMWMSSFLLSEDRNAFLDMRITR